MFARAAVVLACTTLATRIEAQCPDGSPLPCAAPRAVAAVRVPTPDARARRLLLLPFRNVTRNPAQDWLAAGAPLILTDALGQYRDLAVVPEERVTAARRRLRLADDVPLDETQLRRLAEETGGWTVITGNVLAAGPRVRISAQARDIPTARVLARAQVEADTGTDVRPAFQRLSIQLLEAVAGGGGTSDPGADLAALTTRSVDAYRAYLQGIQQLRRSAYTDARRSFAEAVRLDSTFALAWGKLAYAWMSANIFDLIDPANPIGRAIGHASKHAGQLPARQAQLIRSMQLFLAGQPRRARELADSLVATDAEDLEAREWAASVTSMDPTLDVSVRPPRLAASVNRPVLLAKEILERDPGRRHVYSIGVLSYALAAGFFGGLKGGVSGEFPSIGAMFMQATTRDEAVHVVVMRDTLELMPMHEFERLPSGEQAALRARGAAAAWQWIERWRAAGPDDADAHLWASRLADIGGDYSRALREANAAESLGVQSGFENVRTRRVRLLMLTGEHDRAVALADSMLAAGEFAVRTPLTLDQGRAYVAAVFILGKRWNRLEQLVRATGFMPFGGQSPCINIVSEFATGPLRRMEPALLRAVMDTAAAHFGALSASRDLQGCAGNFAGTLLDGDPQRPFGAAQLAEKGDSLYRAGNEAFAYRALRQAWTMDTTAAARRRLSSLDWFMKRSRAMAFPSSFVPESAVVTPDSAVFTYRATERGPWEFSLPDLPSHWAFSIDLPSDSMAMSIVARYDYRPSDGRRTGGIAEMVAAFRTRRVIVARGNTVGTLSRVDATATPAGFRLVVRGPVVAELRRAAPPLAIFRALPCVAVSDGLCAGPALTIQYTR